jgi:predicted alpha-1,2-mannosidase
VLKGTKGIDPVRALDAAVASATYRPYDGIGDYMALGYVPEDRSSSSASKTLEYAYDDWTIARLAERAGRADVARTFDERARSYRRIFDSSTGFMRARNADGSWKSPFDPLSTVGQGFIEGNAWNYSLYVPHDVRGLVGLVGGKEKFVAWLDTLFAMPMPEKYFGESEDITRAGMIGSYVHGNEPSHHVPYLYAYAGRPWKTQKRVHEIVDSMYRNSPDGLCGNDDCGQMSAWYLFSCLGFYPVCPGSLEYVIGSPCVEEGSLDVGGGRKFVVKADNLSRENVYVRALTLNGKPLDRCFITHEDIVRGGELRFLMSAVPNTAWGVSDGAQPYSMTK